MLEHLSGCVQTLLVVIYLVEFARLDFANPGTLTFWIVSFLYYVVYNYSAWLNVIQNVSAELNLM